MIWALTRHPLAGSLFALLVSHLLYPLSLRSGSSCSLRLRRGDPLANQAIMPTNNTERSSVNRRQVVGQVRLNSPRQGASDPGQPRFFHDDQTLPVLGKDCDQQVISLAADIRGLLSGTEPGGVHPP